MGYIVWPSSCPRRTDARAFNLCKLRDNFSTLNHTKWNHPSQAVWCVYLVFLPVVCGNTSYSMHYSMVGNLYGTILVSHLITLHSEMAVHTAMHAAAGAPSLVIRRHCNIVDGNPPFDKCDSTNTLWCDLLGLHLTYLVWSQWALCCISHPPHTQRAGEQRDFSGDKIYHTSTERSVHEHHTQRKRNYLVFFLQSPI